MAATGTSNDSSRLVSPVNLLEECKGMHRSQGSLSSELREEQKATATEGQWWHVNKGGFPIPEETWEEMWEHVIDIHPQGRAIAASIRGRPCKKVHP